MADLPQTVWSLCDTTDLAPYDVCNLWNSVNSTGYVRHKALFILFYFLGAVCRRRYHQTYHGRPPPNGLVAVQHNEGPYDVCNLWNSVYSTGYIRHNFFYFLFLGAVRCRCYLLLPRDLLWPTSPKRFGRRATQRRDLAPYYERD